MTMDLQFKKLLLTVATLVLAIVGHVCGVDKDVLYACIGLVGTFNLGQGLADMGKEAKKIENVSVTKLAADMTKRVDVLEGTIRTVLNNPTRFKP